MVKSLFQICSDHVYKRLNCMQDLKYLNLPPLIFDYFVEREYFWMRELQSPIFCSCTEPQMYSLDDYKLTIYNLTDRCWPVPELVPLRSTMCD